MQQRLVEVRAQVRALQSGRPAEAQEAGRLLAQLQQAHDAVPLCGALLGEASRTGDAAAAFFAAQTLAARARFCGAEDASAWLPLARDIVSILKMAGAGSSSPALSGPALRQSSVALARLSVQLFDVWPEAVDSVLSELSACPCVTPFLEVLQALAEEPFSRRLLVDGSHRSRFLIAFREKVSGILSAISVAGQAQPGIAVIRCATVWLRAQAGFEEWLPMVSFGGAGGAHPALAALSQVFSPLACRAARLELGPEGLEAAAELAEAAAPLAEDFSAEGARSSLVPLLASFVETCGKLPEGGSASPAEADAGLGDAVGALLTVVHAAFSSPALVASEQLASGLLAAGAKLLVLAGPCGGLEVDCDGGLMGRAFDAWDALVTAHRPAADCSELPRPSAAPAPAASAPAIEAALSKAFGLLLAAIPQALRLPPALTAMPHWDLPRMRSRASQLLVLWCDPDDKRVEAMLSSLLSACSCLPPLLDGKQAVAPAQWAEAELALMLAATAAEALAALGEERTGVLPAPLAQLASALPRLPLASAPAPWGRLLEVAAAELVTSLDTWIVPSRYSPASSEGQQLVAFVFRLAGEPRASAAAVDAVATVVSNLAGPLAAEPSLLREAFALLRELCIGAGGPSFAQRERLVRGALGPLLSQLEEAQLLQAVEALAAPLREALPSAGGADAWTPERVAAARLLFYLLAAPQTTRVEVPLQWLSQHWQCLEASMLSPTAQEPAIDAACHALTTILSQGRNSPVMPEVLHKAVPMLTEASVSRGSAAALAALALLARVFKGGSDEATARLFAAHAAAAARRLLGDAPGADQVSQLPPDLLTALLELFTIALGPRCKLFAAQLYQAPGVLAAVVGPVAAALPSCTSPRVVCWGLLLCDRLPQWADSADLGPSAAQLLDATLPGVAAAACRLLAASPLAEDGEVCNALGKALLRLTRARPDAIRLALLNAMGALAIKREEGELFLQQLADPMANEDGLGEALRETAASWQVEHLRREALRGLPP